MILFHKCTLGGLIGILQDIYQNEDYRLCCSSLNSIQLFHRNFCIELEVPESAIICKNENDIDAHTQTPWDEVRIYFKKKYIKKIIGRRRTAITEEDLLFCGEYGIISANNNKEAITEIKKVLKTIKITPIRKSNYSKCFLNIQS